MMQRLMTYLGGPIFDGQRLRQGCGAQFLAGQFSQLVPLAELDEQGEVIDLDGDILSPGYVDLQVNGGGGVMLGDAPSVETIARICDAHRSLGATTILPTLITDTAEKTRLTLKVGVEAHKARRARIWRAASGRAASVGGAQGGP